MHLEFAIDLAGLISHALIRSKVVTEKSIYYKNIKNKIGNSGFAHNVPFLCIVWYCADNHQNFGNVSKRCKPHELLNHLRI